MSDDKDIAVGMAAADAFLKSIKTKPVQGDDKTPAPAQPSDKQEGIGPRWFEF